MVRTVMCAAKSKRENIINSEDMTGFADVAGSFARQLRWMSTSIRQSSAKI